MLLHRYERMSVAMAEYAKQKQVEVSSLRFMFDGERLDPRETGEGLDLEGGECVDVHQA